MQFSNFSSSFPYKLIEYLFLLNKCYTLLFFFNKCIRFNQLFSMLFNCFNLFFLCSLSILPDDNADIFSACLLLLYCSFSPLILASTVIFSFYILSKMLHLNCKGLSDGKVVSLTKKKYGFALQFSQIFIKSWMMISNFYILSKKDSF